MVKQKKINKLQKKDKTSGRYLSVSDGSKAELFIRINILPFIIAERKKDLKLFSIIQEDILKEVEEHVKISKISYEQIGIFLSALITNNYDGNHIIMISELTKFLNAMRLDKKSVYIPHIFRPSVSLGARRIFLEYLNFLYCKEYNSKFEVRYSKRFKYFIQTIADVKLTSNEQPLHGLTAYICVPKQFKEYRSIIEIQGKIFEMHGPGSLVLVGCHQHQYCKFPSFECVSNKTKGNLIHNIVPDTSNRFTYLLIKSIKKNKAIRCFYGNEYPIDNNYICECKSCDFNA
jgi:hypothetical protein